jgi:hypothetical protein
VFVGAFCNLRHAVNAHDALLSQLRIEREETDRYLTTYAQANGRQGGTLNVLWTYGTDAPCYALWFGNAYADNAFEEEISEICPHDMHFNIVAQQVRAHGEWVPISSVGNWDVIVMAEQFLPMYPYVAAYGVARHSSVPTVRYGRLAFIHHQRE